MPEPNVRWNASSSALSLGKKFPSCKETRHLRVSPHISFSCELLVLASQLRPEKQNEADHEQKLHRMKKTLPAHALSTSHYPAGKFLILHQIKYCMDAYSNMEISNGTYLNILSILGNNTPKYSWYWSELLRKYLNMCVDSMQDFSANSRPRRAGAKRDRSAPTLLRSANKDVATRCQNFANFCIKFRKISH